MNGPADRTMFVSEMIMHFGLSPKERFALGSALICQCIEQANAEFPGDNPFSTVTLDPKYPFKMAGEGLLIFHAYMKGQEEAEVPTKKAAP